MGGMSVDCCNLSGMSVDCCNMSGMSVDCCNMSGMSVTYREAMSPIAVSRPIGPLKSASFNGKEGVSMRYCARCDGSPHKIPPTNRLIIF
jgi:hypothetical protein